MTPPLTTERIRAWLAELQTQPTVWRMDRTDEIAALTELLALRAEREQRTTALRRLRDVIVDVAGDYENCEDCGDIEMRPCAVHASETLYAAVLAADEVLGPCRCGHARSDHHTEDSTACKVCRIDAACHGFRLPPVVPRP